MDINLLKPNDSNPRLINDDQFIKLIEGRQLRYIYLIDKSCKITVPILPFSKIDEMGAGMYKGKKITLAERQTRDNSINGNAAAVQVAEGVRGDLIAQKLNSDVT